MKVIYSGLESSGKSLKLAMLVSDLVWRNHKWYKKQILEYKKMGVVKYEKKYGSKMPVPRPLYSNLKFSEKFTEYAEDLGVPISYWENIDDLIRISDADVICDEVGNYFDARLWGDLSLDARRWLSQGAKAGIEFYGTAQDFAQVDKAFRRLCNVLIHVTKMIGSRRPSATKPPVKRIWGMCMTRELDPNAYDEDKKKFTGGIMPSFFYIRRQYCEMFDTTQIIARSKPEALKHVERFCLDKNCAYHVRPKIAHV